MSLRRFDQLIDRLRQRVAAFSDRRTGRNTKYTMEDISLSAFSVFYTQCPSFLSHQKVMQQTRLSMARTARASNTRAARSPTITARSL
jgi:hypothetical protein